MALPRAERACWRSASEQGLGLETRPRWLLLLQPSLNQQSRLGSLASFFLSCIAHHSAPAHTHRSPLCAVRRAVRRPCAVPTTPHTTHHPTTKSQESNVPHKSQISTNNHVACAWLHLLHGRSSYKLQAQPTTPQAIVLNHNNNAVVFDFVSQVSGCWTTVACGGGGVCSLQLVTGLTTTRPDSGPTRPRTRLSLQLL